ncbi:hypothetical protein V1477_015008 [Vespula maculifrons]|uniref:Uncharacterized protein n=3 Tax=Vespula TaxID=7451 RepID=A0A834N076_VESGE|nr:hypothetical protein HZH66_010118 [Vespula vulgaris]KAF7391905.1 hypothetical protein HZH68_011448 [Vespula germanica]
MKSPGVSAAREFALSRLVHFTKSLSTHPPYFEIAKEEGSNLGFAALPGIIVALTLRRSFSSVAILDNARFSRLKREAKGRVFKVLARGVVDDDKISKDKSNGICIYGNTCSLKAMKISSFDFFANMTLGFQHQPRNTPS